MVRFVFSCFVVFCAACSSCASGGSADVASTTGPHPLLEAPANSVVPTVNISTAKGWTAGQAPQAAAGTSVHAFAQALDHPRWLYVLPNGDVLVAETNGPDRPDDKKSIKGKLMQVFQKKAGGDAPSANRITRLRDTDGDGLADVRSAFLSGLRSPFGMALIGDRFFHRQQRFIGVGSVSQWRYRD